MEGGTAFSLSVFFFFSFFFLSFFFFFKTDRSSGNARREIQRRGDRGSEKGTGRVESEGWELSPAMIPFFKMLNGHFRPAHTHTHTHTHWCTSYPATFLLTTENVNKQFAHPGLQKQTSLVGSCCQLATRTHRHTHTQTHCEINMVWRAPASCWCVCVCVHAVCFTGEAG